MIAFVYILEMTKLQQWRTDEQFLRGRQIQRSSMIEFFCSGGTVYLNCGSMNLYMGLNCIELYMGFPNSSVGKESTCNSRDRGLIPGSGRSAGEGKGYPLQYSWASLVAQLVKNQPAMRETWVPSLGWENPL